MKSGWERYAAKERYIQKGYLRKHCDGGSGRKAREASRSNSLQQSRQVQEEEIEVPIQLYGKVVLLTEECVYTGAEETVEQVLEKTYHLPPVEKPPKKPRKKKLS